MAFTELEYAARGVSQFIFQARGGKAEVWNGVTRVNDNVDTEGFSTIYIDGEGRHFSTNQTDYNVDLQAYSYPPQLEEGQFDLAYTLSSAQDETSFEIHILYNCLGALKGTDWTTKVNSSVPVLFEINITTLPAKTNATGLAPGSHVIIKLDSLSSEIKDDLLNLLHGGDDDARIPPLDELIEFLESRASLRIIDHGDGTWTAIGSDDIVRMISATEFEINWPSAVVINPDSYIVSSL